MRLRTLIAALMTLSVSASAGELVDGALTVDGKPFYPLGGWDFPFTTADDLNRMGMNVSFRIPSPTDEGMDKFRQHMRECAEHGIQLVPYISYGGAGVIPWETEKVRRVAELASEPNLLAWYVGDDITMVHLDGIQQTVNTLREETPNIATVADYIASETPEAQTVFTKYIDIRCQYNYPIPNETYEYYMNYFDEQREFVGDPLWTWVQSFMWGSTANQFGLGIQDCPGPIPDPEQVRLMAHAAVNRGVRGLMFFPHHSLQLVPELAGEVALFCRELGLFNDQLAAGEQSLNLPTSQADVNAAAFTHDGSVALSVMLMKDHYHRWIDDGIAENVTVRVPWEGRKLPTALLVATPDVAECTVERVGSDSVDVTIPRFEIAGFILLSADRSDLRQVRRGVQKATEQLAVLALPAAVSQTRKVSSQVWRTGFEHLYRGNHIMNGAYRLNEQAASALQANRSNDVVSMWREAMRENRMAMDSLMNFAEARREIVPANRQAYLLSPYSLHKIEGLMSAPPADSPWNFVDDWLVTGPFALGMESEQDTTIPSGMLEKYPPELGFDRTAIFEVVDGRANWQLANADMSGKLDLLHYFGTTVNVIAYARTVVVAPSDMQVDMSLGSNDGAQVLVNGESVFLLHTGRGASPHMDTIPVNLREGENEILVKVENYGSNWQLYLSFDDPDRKLEFRVQ
jgi:hypothetical protein